MRRVLAPLGGAISFLCVVLLVIGGLTWVTIEALHVESERALATARADAAQQERLALWQLDSRLFPAWGVENNRAYAHYFAFYTPYPVVVDNAWANGEQRAASPLLTSELPDWMTLHFQLDPEQGWDSPQVMGNEREVALRTQLMAVCNMPQSVNDFRCGALAELRVKFPVKASHDQLMSLESMNPGDSPLAVPYLFEPQQPAMLPPVLPPPGPPGPPITVKGGGAVTPPPTVQPSIPNAEPGPGGGSSGAAFAPKTAEPPPAPAAPTPPVDNSVTRAVNSGRGGRGESNPPQITDPPPGYKARDSVAKKTQEDFRRYDGNTQASNSVTGNVQNGNVQNGNLVTGGLPPAMTPATPTPVDPKLEEGARKETDKDVPSAVPAKVIAPVSLKPPASPGGAKAEEAKPEEAKKSAEKVAAGSILFGAFEALKDKPADRDGKHAPKLDAKKVILPTLKPPTVQIGPMRPVWLKGASGQEVLILVRAARLETKTVFQGVLLDWTRLRDVLLGEILAQLPQAKLEAVRDAAPNERLMTALPATLDPGPEPTPPPLGWTPLRIGLTLGWVAALLALAAVGFVGWTLIDLSERRIRFVSAVTHELRTPLTALRLYTDLLSSGMIAEEEKQKEYLRTLGHESERLNTLIENVLDFAKLEKRTVQAHCVPLPVAELLEQSKLTWADRLTNEGREFVVVSTLPAEQCVTTDARIASQILGNLIDNARKYSQEAEEKRIWLWARPGEKGRIVFEVEDRGPGVAASESGTIFRPFRRGQNVSATGGAGLGLALARQWSDLLGGTLSYRCADGGVGACFRLELPG